MRRRGEPQRSLEALGESVARFNSRWRRWVEEEAELDELNRQVDGYNRHYRDERQAALRYVPVNKVGFEPKPPVTTEDVLARLPLLPTS